MQDSLRVGRIAGIPVGINWSVLVVAWLITWSLASFRFPDAYPGHTPGAYWLTGAATAVVFLASLLAHELGHSILARRHGVQVEGITLWLLGGVAKLRSEPKSPEADLRIAAVGPAVSLGLGLGFGVLALAFGTMGAPELVTGALGWLAFINVLLAVFNLMPAAPLDGGRVLRAVVWRRTGNQLRAAVTAARAGRAFGYGLVGLGLFGFALGAGIGGLWFVFLGWFLLSAARAEEMEATTRGALAGVRVRDVMSPEPVVAPGWLTVEAFLADYVLTHRFSAFPIEDFDGRLAGLVTLARLKAVPPERRGSVRVLDAACPIDQVPRAAPDEPLVDLLARMAGCSDHRALVFDDGRLVGIVTPTDVHHALEVAHLRGW